MDELDFFETLAKDAIKRDELDVKMFRAFDKMENCQWEMPEALRKLPGMRKNVNTEPADAVRAATRVYSSVLPTMELFPLNHTQEEKERMEKIEQVLSWNFAKLNARPVPPLYQIIHNAVQYMRIAFQVEYYPHLLKGKTDTRSKYLRRNGDFGWRIFDPKDVHAYYDDDGVEAVILDTILSVKELETRFADSKGVKKLVEIMEKKHDKGEFNHRETRVRFMDYTDWENRVQWCYETEQSEGEKYEILMEEHKLPFINWVVASGKNPILKSVYDSNAWDDANIIGSLRNRLILSAAAHPAYVTKTVNKDGVEIDYDDGLGAVNVRTNEDVQSFPPRQLDPHLTEIYAESAMKIRNTSGTKYLQNLDFPANTPFSSINALISASLSNLGEAKRLAEIAIADGHLLNLCWISYSKERTYGQRRDTKDSSVDTMTRGAQIGISGTPENLLEGETYIGDPYDITIEISLQADTANDKQARLNRATTMHDRLKVPISRSHEELGMDNSANLIEEWQQEQIDDAELKVALQKIAVEGDENIKQQIIAEFMQQQQEQMLQQQQQAQGQPGNTQEVAFANAKGEGFATNQGGEPPQEMAPDMTREVMSGQTRSEEEIV